LEKGVGVIFSLKLFTTAWYGSKNDSDPYFLSTAGYIGVSSIWPGLFT